MVSNEYHLIIKTKIWKRTTNLLFDHDSLDYRSQNIQISNSGKLMKTTNNVSYNALSEDFSSETQEQQDVLATIEEKTGYYQIQGKLNEVHEEYGLWLPLGRDGNQKRKEIKENDIIKLGRVKFKILKIQLKTESQTQDKDPVEDILLDYMQEHMKPLQNKAKTCESSNKEQNNSDVTCRICLFGTSEDDGDPLLNPCNCSGTIGHLHLKCLRKWILNKIQLKKKHNIMTVLWSNIKCELCQTELPLKMRQSHEEIFMINFKNKIKGSYLILQSFSKENKCNGLHVIGFDSSNSCTIVIEEGRAQECDLKIPDVSVSRKHAEFSIEEDRVLLEDKKSRFGTLVMIKDDIIINKETPESQWFQAGKTLIKFQLEKTGIPFISWLNSWLCFERSESLDKKQEKAEKKMELKAIRAL